MAEPDLDLDALPRWLAGRDVPCPLCGYNLRGLTTDRCPECGQLLRLGISLAEPFLKAWVALLVAVLLPTGFGILLLIVLGYIVASSHATDLIRELGNAPLGPIMIALYLAASVPSSILVLAFRRRFLRLSRATQGGSPRPRGRS